MSASTILDNYIRMIDDSFHLYSRSVSSQYSVVIAWMMKQVISMSDPLECHITAVMIMVRYLSGSSVSIDNLYNVSVASMLISESLVTGRLLVPSDYSKYTDQNLETDSIVTIVSNIVTKCEGQLLVPSSISFFNLLSIMDGRFSELENYSVREVLVVITANPQSFLFKQYDLAITAALLVKNNPRFILIGEYRYTDYVPKIHNLMRMLRDVIDRVSDVCIHALAVSDTYPYDESLSLKNLPNNIQSDETAVETTKMFDYKSDVVGKGYFGVITKAELNDEVLAIKTQCTDVSVGQPIVEIAMMKTLSHCNIEVMKSFSISPVSVSFSMLFRECDLASYIYDRVTQNNTSTYNRISRLNRRRIARGILDGLSYIHSMGIIHNDIKPQNILLTSDLTPKIIDFGLSRAFIASEMSYYDGTIATFMYSPPEQITAALHNSHIDLFMGKDVWSAGVTILELEQGMIVFNTDNKYELLGIIEAIVIDNGLQIVADGNLRRLLVQMLDFDPYRRISARQAIAHL